MPLATIGLIPHPSKDVTRSIRLLREWDAAHPATLIALESDAARVGDGIELVTEAAFLERAEAVVALGGDGTMLGAMRLVAGREPAIPVLGVNYGNLGFLVEVEPAELPEALDRLAADDFQLEGHHALEVVVRGADGSVRAESLAFNDVAVARMPGAGVVTADLRVDGRPYGYYRGDAVVVATSAGSTAYNYAAGGPVMSPSLVAAVISPVAPMTGIDRAVVLSAREPMEFELGDGTRGAAVEIDGRVAAEVSAGDLVQVRLRADAATVIRFDAERHASRGRVKLSLLDLPLRQDQLLQLVPEAVRAEAARRRR
jgi:NAD+ kinase